MKWRIAVLALAGFAWGPGIRSVHAQAMLADDIILLSKGQREQERAKTESHLGTGPGGDRGAFRVNPGSGEPRLGEGLKSFAPSFPTSMRERDVLSAISSPRLLPGSRLFESPFPQVRQPTLPEPLPIGPLALPSVDDEGPEDGLTLDAAIEQFLRGNFDLRTKFRELPKAQADILSAGLRGNPLFFASADSVPYGNYSQQRPGENSYNVTVIQPVDANRKRKVRVLVAQQAKKVFEAQYQDAVRTGIDALYASFVDVLEARETVRFAEAGLKGLKELVRATEDLVGRGEQPQSEADRVQIQRDSAEVALGEAKATLQRAKEALATLIGIPAEQADLIEVRGSIRDQAPPPPPLEDLTRVALCNRPDVFAYRLGVGRAQSAVRLEQAERFPDIFVLYTPYGFQNNSPLGEKSATSWGVGVLATIPLFNRNQGNIARAKETVIQTQTELQGLERQVVSEVRRAYLDFETTGAAVRRIEQEILPKAEHLYRDKARLVARGQESALVLLNAQRDYSETIRQYRDTLIRHRRGMLRLNTAVGLRVLP
ncbi:MAG: TolC family protein [Isosphaeraceae bacterium]